MSDFNKSSLSEIVNLIKSKKASSLEVTNHFIKNIENIKLIAVRAFSPPLISAIELIFLPGG